MSGSIMAIDTLVLERRVEALLAPWRGRQGPGATIGLARDGEMLVHRSAGLASIEHDVPIGPETTFRIASVSKQFTCAAIMLLAAEGRLRPQDEVRAHLPELPDYGVSLTLDHLMHNTSGLRDMLEIMRLGGADLGQPVRTQDLLDGIWRQRALNFAPGSRYLYSNTNFLLLGVVVERLSGQSLADFLAERIFAPLGMTRTRLSGATTDVVPGLATGYFPVETGGWARARHGFPIGGEGGLVSCVADLAIWARNAQTHRLGGIALATALEAQAPFTNGATNGYARGLQVLSRRGLRVIGHGGLWPGYKTQYTRVPELGLTVIAITNDASADAYHLARDALDAVLDGEPAVVAMPKPAPREALAPLAGRWIEPETGATLDIDVVETGDAVGRTHGVPFRLEPAADGRFEASRSARDFTVRALENGTIEVEQDAGVRALYRRVAENGALPPGLGGRYASDEMAATWTVVEQDGSVFVWVAGPLVVDGPWTIEPVEGDVVRVLPPKFLFASWMDARVMRGEDGSINGLLVDGGRARGVTFTRMPG